MRARELLHAVRQRESVSSAETLSAFSALL
jgi:hypothetical protein